MTGARRSGATLSTPSFLFFITDQQRWDHVGYAGNAIVQTPNIDRIAEGGSWLSRFYVSSPTCMSNRATFMTGRIPRVNGVRYNGIPLDLDSVTFVDLLLAAGYRTALVGKSHLQGMTSESAKVPREVYPDGLRPPPDALAEARRTSYARDDYAWEMSQEWARPGHAENIRTPFYGFEDVAFCLGHGDLVTGHYSAWLRKKAPDLDVQPGLAGARAVSEVRAAQVYLPAVPEDLYPTRFVQEETVAWLEGHAERGEGRPFFVQCSFPDPHHPFTPAGRYYGMYDADEVGLPPSFHTPTRDATPPLARLWDEYERGTESTRWTYPFVTGERRARDMLAKTYGQITMIDDAVGAVLDTLQRVGLAENTVICFLSDHGEYLGDHGLMLKGPMQYQSIVRTPFAWRDPDPAYNRGHLEEMGSMLDLARTVLSRAGLQPYNGVQGVDLCPLFRGESAMRDEVLVEYTTQYPYLGFDDLVTVSTLIDRRWRISVWQNRDWGELYDLSNDPHELTNLWNDPASARVRESLLIRRVHALQNHADTSPYPLSVA